MRHDHAARERRDREAVARPPPGDERDPDDRRGVDEHRTDEERERPASEDAVQRREGVEEEGAEVVPPEPVEHANLDEMVPDVTDVQLRERVVGVPVEVATGGEHGQRADQEGDERDSERDPERRAARTGARRRRAGFRLRLRLGIGDGLGGRWLHGRHRLDRGRRAADAFGGDLVRERHALTGRGPFSCHDRDASGSAAGVGLRERSPTLAAELLPVRVLVVLGAPRHVRPHALPTGWTIRGPTTTCHPPLADRPTRRARAGAGCVASRTSPASGNASTWTIR